MTNRSYAQIRWHGDRLGLLLVNPSREKFFIYAEKLELLFSHSDEYIVIKERDRKPTKAVGYYPGMVMGTADVQEGSDLITLYVGEPYRDLSQDEETLELRHWITILEFRVPSDEMTKFREVMSLMAAQQATFAERLEEAEATLRVQYDRPKRGG